MTDQTVLPLYKEALFDIFEETFDKVMGIYLDRGTSLFETLEPITAELASRPVSATCANLAAQVNHVRVYLDALTRAASGEDIGKIDWDASWQVGEVSEEEWIALKQGLRDQVDLTISTFKSFETWGEDQIGEAMAIAVHTAYHLGEIRQALCTLTA